MGAGDYLQWKRRPLQTTFFAFVVVCAFMVFLLSMYTDTTSENPVTMGEFHEELISNARKEANCTKPDGASEYVVCERLPYSEIRCGEFAKPREVTDKQGRKYLVPDVIHFIWFGPFNLTKFYQYLTLRSVASIQSPRKILIHHDGDVVENEIWERVKEEIPCIEMVNTKKPNKFFRFKVPSTKFAADVARLQILKEHGGIYLDLDVITLKPLEPMRIYPAAMGRAAPKRASAGIIFCEKGSEFINTWMLWYQALKYKTRRGWDYFAQNIPYSLAWQEQGGRMVHLEEVSFNRPNPFTDGVSGSFFGHVDIANNYFLHLHPTLLKNRPEIYQALVHWKGDRLRTLDNSYGQAARIALFGSEDLVFFPGEQIHEPLPKRRIIPFPENGSDPLPNIRLMMRGRDEE